MKGIFFIGLTFFSGFVFSANQISDFALLDHQGNFHQLSAYRDQQALVIVAHANSCSIMNDTIAELTNISDRYAQSGVAFLLLNATSTDDRDSLAQWAKRSSVKFPVLVDKTQLIAESLGFQTCAEALIIDPTNMKIHYRGPISQNLSKDKKSDIYLEGAIQRLLKGEDINVENKTASGDRINYPPSQLISYQKNIVPILERRCTQCHVDGGIAPWAMNSHAMISGWSPMIKEVVLTKRMPPGQIDEHYGDFVDLHHITDVEKRQLIKWIDQGAKKDGSVDPLEGLQPNESEWQFGTPDKIVKLPKQEIPATGVIPYGDMVVDLELDEDTWLKGYEMRAGDATVVHHVTVNLLQGEHRPFKFGDGFFTTRIGGYAPGKPGLMYPDNAGKFITKGSKLAVQIHYTTSGKATIDESQVALYFTDEEPESEMKADAAFDMAFSIPPGVKQHEVRASKTFIEDSELYSLSPHMHLRGDRMKYIAHFPDGRSKVLLSVPHYNFNWQLNYQLAKPEFLPAGTKLEAIAAYNNSKLNPSNPDSTQTVYYGLQSFEEMLFGFMDYRVPRDRQDEAGPKHKPLTEVDNESWLGTWNSYLAPYKLHISKVKNNQVEGYYGRSENTGSYFGRNKEGSAEIIDDRLHIALESGSTIELQLYRNNSEMHLFGSFSNGGVNPSPADFTLVE